MHDRVRTPRRAGTALAYAMLCVVMALWAGNSIVGRAVRDTIPPFTLAFARWAGALCLVGPFAARRVAADRATLRRHWRIVLLLGLVGVAAFNGFLYSGLRLTTATNGLLLQATVPALVLLFGVLLRQSTAPRNTNQATAAKLAEMLSRVRGAWKLFSSPPMITLQKASIISPTAPPK